MIDAETNQEITYDKYNDKLTDGLMSEEESIILFESGLFGFEQEKEFLLIHL